VNTEIQFDRMKWGVSVSDPQTGWLSGYTTIDGVKVELVLYTAGHYQLDAERDSLTIRQSLGYISYEDAVKRAHIFANMVNAALGIYDAALSVREAA
jgi:hypothetical protein